MECQTKFVIGTCGFVLAGSYLIYNLTKNYYSSENRINLIENNIINMKEKVADLELFKLKIYTNEISMGRRTWEEDVMDSEDDLA
jgi:hypothetical protein